MLLTDGKAVVTKYHNVSAPATDIDMNFCHAI